MVDYMEDLYKKWVFEKSQYNRPDMTYEQKHSPYAEYLASLSENIPGQRPKFYREYLNENPGEAYNYFLSTLDKGMSDFWANSYNDLYGEYQGQVGKENLGANQQFSQMGFLDYLEKQNMANRYNQLTSRQKGFYPATASPRGRFLNY